MPTLMVAKEREHFWATVCVRPKPFALSPPLILTELCGRLANVLNLPKRKPRPRAASVRAKWQGWDGAQLLMSMLGALRPSTQGIL